MVDRDLYAKKPLAEELPAFLEARGMSMSSLAKEVGVTRAHLSRAVRGVDRKKISPELARRIAEALSLNHDRFAEFREGEAIRAIRDDPDLRDRVYLMAQKRNRD